MSRHPRSVDTLVLTRIRSRRRGTVFTPAHFVDLGSRTAVASALKRHKAAGAIRHLGWGLYDVPRHHPMLGVLWPSVEAVIKALQVKDPMRLQPAGVHAANLLGISEQVPAKVVFLTDGASRLIKAGPMRIHLWHTSSRSMAAAGRLSGLVIEAFRCMGKHSIGPARLARLRNEVPLKVRRRLLADLALAPAWMHPHFRYLAEP